MEKILEKICEGIEYPFLAAFLKEPSKRIRSRLAILYLQLNNKPLDNNIYNVLAAGELIHNASLLHDDVIDDADKRRGQTTLGKSLSYKMSIVAGDYLISHAISKLLEIRNSQIIEIFQNCTKCMCEGEISQYFSRGNIPSLEEYINICKNKTGRLFSAILESCALLADIDISKARRFGEVYGVYFQIKNDLEEESAYVDKKNEIYTAKEVLGLENTLSLLDNCREEMLSILGDFPNNIHRQELEGLFKS